MPGKNHDLTLAILEAAVAEPIGLVLMCSDPTKARMALYATRKAVNDPEFNRLQFRMWPYEDGNLVICHEAPAPKPNNLGAIDLGGILDLDLDVD